jgi:thymidylate synthase (FAD)
MKFIEPSVEIIQQEPGIDGMMKIIEMAGRTAYKSEDHITEDSAKRFVKMLKDKKHGAALEHGTCYLDIPKEVWNDLVDDHDLNFIDCPYQWFGYSGLTDDYIHLTTNYRVLVEHGYESLLDGMVEPTEEDFENEIFKRRITVKFTCDRGVSHEFVRHRVFSFLQESTRYCNYGKDKFGNQITFIIPRWIHDIQEEIASTVDSATGLSREYFRDYQTDILMNNLTTVDRTVSSYMDTLQAIEDCYLDMTMEDGLKPQQARQILPNALKTELIMTGTIEQWEGFFKLRCAPSAHPDAKHLADMLREKFLNEGYIK